MLLPKNLFTRHLSAFDHAVYRCYYSVSPSENLFADIGFADEGESLDFIQSLADCESGISHLDEKIQRPFAYTQLSLTAEWSCLSPEILRPLRESNRSRFSDGSYGVWYGALERPTAYTESLYWAFQFSKDDFKHAPARKRTIDRKMIKVKVSAQLALDLQGFSGNFDLCSDSYEDCHEIGRFAKQSQIEMVISPSARVFGGLCTPIFCEKVLSAYQDVGWYRFEMSADGTVLMTHRKNSTVVQIAG